MSRAMDCPILSSDGLESEAMLEPDMGSPDHFMRYASEALRAAELARAERDRLALIELARTWVEAALVSAQRAQSAAGL